MPLSRFSDDWDRSGLNEPTIAFTRMRSRAATPVSSGPVDRGSFQKLDRLAAQSAPPRVWPPSDYQKVRSYCQRGDPVCNFSSLAEAIGRGLEKAACPHERYIAAAIKPGVPYTLDAALPATARLRVRQPPLAAVGPRAASSRR